MSHSYRRYIFQIWACVEHVAWGQCHEELWGMQSCKCTCTCTRLLNDHETWCTTRPLWPCTTKIVTYSTERNIWNPIGRKMFRRCPKEAKRRENRTASWLVEALLTDWDGQSVVVWPTLAWLPNETVLLRICGLKYSLFTSDCSYNIPEIVSVNIYMYSRTGIGPTWTTQCHYY